MEAIQIAEEEGQNRSETKDLAPGLKPQKDTFEEKESGRHEAHLIKEAQTPDLESPSQQEIPPWAKELQSKLEALERERQAGSIRTQAKALLSKSRLPDSLKDKWLSRIQPQGGSPIEEQVKALEEEYAEIEKTLLSKSSAYGLPLGGVAHAIGEKEVKNILANI